MWLCHDNMLNVALTEWGAWTVRPLEVPSKLNQPVILCSTQEITGKAVWSWVVLWTGNSSIDLTRAEIWA